MAFASCGHKEPTHVLIPEINESGETVLSEVQLETLSNPRVVEGPAAIVYENPLFTGFSFDGKVAEPLLTQNDHLWVPLDVKSSSALAIYYGYEQIKKFEDRVIPEFSVKWPRKVAFDLRFTENLINNAYYFTQSDLTALLPYHSSGLPVAFNSGILAHEHFHAHFQRLIGQSVNTKLPWLNVHSDTHLHTNQATGDCGMGSLPEENLKPEDPMFRQMVNFYILRGWNEGLADFYALLVTGHTNSFDLTFDQKRSRKVDESPGAFATRDMFEVSMMRDLDEKTQDGVCWTVELAYIMGTQVARSLHEAAQAEHKALDLTAREQITKAMFTRLSEASSSMLTQMTEARVEPSWILSQLLPAIRSSEPTPTPPVEEPEPTPSATVPEPEPETNEENEEVIHL